MLYFLGWENYLLKVRTLNLFLLKSLSCGTIYYYYRICQHFLEKLARFFATPPADSGNHYPDNICRYLRDMKNCACHYLAVIIFSLLKFWIYPSYKKL
jgi:hypothetical protein